MYPTVPSFNLSGPQTGYPYAPKTPAPNLTPPDFQNQAFQGPVGGSIPGYPNSGPFSVPQNAGTTYPGQAFNDSQANGPSFNPNSQPQETGRPPVGSNMGAGGAPGEPSSADLEALLSQLQSLSSPGGEPGGGQGTAPSGDPRGVSGHAASGSIVVQPDGSVWDMSNGGSSGGLLSKLTLKNLFKLVVAGGAVWGAWYFVLSRLFKGGAVQSLQTEPKQFHDFLEKHAKRLSEVTEAVKSKSKDKITQLGAQVKSELKGLLEPYTENLPGEEANKNIMQAAQNRHQELYDVAAQVTDSNVTETIGKVTDKAREAQEALLKVKTEIIDKEG